MPFCMVLFICISLFCIQTTNVIYTIDCLYSWFQIWKGLNHRTGCDLKHVVKILTDGNIINSDVREKSIRFVIVHLDKFLCTREKAGRAQSLERCARYLCIGKFTWLTGWYVEALRIKRK